MVVCLGVASVALATGGAGVIGPALSSVGSFVGSLFGPAASTSVAVQTIGAGVSGVVAGASTSGTMAGTVAGGSLAAGVTATKAGIDAGALSDGPVGWLAVGAAGSADGNQTTYDCWKPVVHDTSEEPSSGMALRDLVSHQNIANVVITPGRPTGLPHIILENIWNEKFEIEYLVLQDTGKCVCHAKPFFI